MSTSEEAQKYYQEGNYKDAAIAWGKVIDSASDDIELYSAYWSRGVAYFLTGEYLEAVNDATKAIGIDPKHPIPYYIRAASYKSMGRYDDARADFWRSIEKGNERAMAYLGLGEAVFKLEGERNARPHFLKALKLAENEKSEAITEHIWDTIKSLDWQSFKDDMM